MKDSKGQYIRKMPPEGAQHWNLKMDRVAWDKIEKYVEKHGWNGGYVATLVGVSAGTISAYMAMPEFADMVHRAKCVFMKVLEDAAYKRGVEGIETVKSVDKNTGEVYYETKYSDKLLQTVLKANDVEKKFVEKLEVKKEISGSIEHNHTHKAAIDLESLDEEQRAQLRSFLTAKRITMDAPE